MATKVVQRDVTCGYRTPCTKVTDFSQPDYVIVEPVWLVSV